jgi:predicted dehydrogenase
VLQASGCCVPLPEALKASGFEKASQWRLSSVAGQPRYLLTRGGAGASATAGRVTRVPPGHPEGYLEAFATIYSEAAQAIRAMRSGKKLPKDVVFPSVEDGLWGMRFVDACVRSSKKNAAWVKF